MEYFETGEEGGGGEEGEDVVGIGFAEVREPQGPTIDQRGEGLGGEFAEGKEGGHEDGDGDETQSK